MNVRKSHVFLLPDNSGGASAVLIIFRRPALMRKAFSVHKTFATVTTVSRLALPDLQHRIRPASESCDGDVAADS